MAIKMGTPKPKAQDKNVTISGASYSGTSFSVGGQDNIPEGIFFNPTGTKMFMVGRSNDRVYQYTLGTGFDLSTASYDSVSFSVSGQDDRPRDIYFNATGTKMFMIGSFPAPELVYQYTLGTGFDLSTASYDSVSYNVSSEDGLPRGVFFNPTGTKMFMLGRNSANVYQYTLGTGFDLSSASYDNVSVNLSSEDNRAEGIFFNSTGTKLFMAGRDSDSVYQYTLGTGFDLSTAAYDSVSLDVSSQDGYPTGIFFNDVGTKMFMVGRNTNSVYEYDL